MNEPEPTEPRQPPAETGPPKILNMSWCDGCDRIDWHIAFRHYSQGKYCPGLVHQLIFDLRV